MQKKTITLNGNFTSPVNVSSSLNVNGDSVSFNTPNGTDNITINDKSLTEILDENKPNVSSSTEYTAIEVFATDTDITAGTIDEVTGLEYKVDVPANMTCEFMLRSDGNNPWDGVRIEWGDGEESTSGEVQTDVTRALFTHTYSAPGRYTVKFYGKFYGFTSPKNKQNNLICRIWDDDLPCASNVYCWKMVCIGSLRLQKVHIPATYRWPNNVIGLYQIFKDCSNLLEFVNLSASPFCGTMQGMFQNCINITSIEFEYEQFGMWKSIDNRYPDMFNGCRSLTTPIWKLLPFRGWLGGNVVVIRRLFNNCISLPAEIQRSNIYNIGDVLWNIEPYGYRFDKQQLFDGCSEDLLSLIPTTWGGTLSLNGLNQN